MTSQEAPDTSYIAAHATIAWNEPFPTGRLALSGSNRREFLQRLSTNDCRKLAAGRGLPTVLCTATGRVLALVIAYEIGDALSLQTPAQQAAGLTTYLNSLIFWNDTVTVTNLSAATAEFELFGPAATAALAGLTGLSLDGVATYSCHQAQISAAAVTVERGGSLTVPEWTIMVAKPEAAQVRAALAPLGPALDPATYTLLRVEKGIPASRYELSDQVTPLEAGLRAAISDNKGCYTGQEIIARQLNYDKVTRRLVGLRLPADAPYAELAGATVSAGSKRGGFVGTTAWSPALARPIALAIIPRDLAQTGTVVTVKHGDAEFAAEVAELPFTRTGSVGDRPEPEVA